METRGRPIKYKNNSVTCPNPKCRLHGEWKKGNIVSYGKYRSKTQGKTKRFKCKECGITFSYRTDSVWEGLQSPSQKFYEALKLLVKGAPIRFVAEVLDVKPDTVRRWLNSACEGFDMGSWNEMIQAGYGLDRSEHDFMYYMFVERGGGLDVSVEEIDALRLAVENGEMRQRAWEWKKKYGHIKHWLQDKNVDTMLFLLEQAKDRGESQ